MLTVKQANHAFDELEHMYKQAIALGHGVSPELVDEMFKLLEDQSYLINEMDEHCDKDF